MEPDPIAATVTTTPVRGGPSGSQARRGSASAASRAKSGVAAVKPPSPVRTADSKVIEPARVEAARADDEAQTAALEEELDAAVEEALDGAAVGALATATVSAAPATASAGAPAAPANASATIEQATVEEATVEEATIEEAGFAPSVVDDATAIAAAAAATATAPVPAPAPTKPRTSGRPARSTPVRDAAPASPAAKSHTLDIALSVVDLSKSYGAVKAADSVNLEVRSGSLYGIVGPNGAGKTTTLSMISGLLRPDSGVVRVYGADVWANPAVAKKSLGVLPDRLRLFDRLTGAEFLQHAGALHGLDRATATHRAADLASAFGLQPSMRRFVSDYSVGLTKKIAIAASMIHSPRLLVLDEPFESVDPVSAQTVIDILTRFTEAGGTVLLSSHSMELIQKICDSVAIIADGRVLTAGPIETVLDGRSLEERFVELAGGTSAVEGMEWLQSFSD